MRRGADPDDRQPRRAAANERSERRNMAADGNRQAIGEARFGKVAVLFGGSSAEREISLKSGSAVLGALKRCGVDAHPVDPRDGLLRQLEAGGFDRAFIVLHGRGGEDGTVQGALDYLGLPYTGSGVLASALAMDKWRTKLIWQALDLPTPEYRRVTGAAELAEFQRRLGGPVAVKPAREGSSIGMTKLLSADDAPAAYAQAVELDDCVIAERWIQGGEYTASILGDRVLPLIRMETPRAFYDYEAKYFTDSTKYYCPCGLPGAQETELARVCKAAFEAVGASGWGRVDFMLDGEGRPWLLEVNTVPGMTDHSLVPMAARAVGIGFEELVLRILEQTLAERVEVAR